MSADKLTVSDQYTLLGLKLKSDGRIRCLFCHRYAIIVPGAGVTVPHTPDCVAAKIFQAPEVSDGK